MIFDKLEKIKFIISNKDTKGGFSKTTIILRS